MRAKHESAAKTKSRDRKGHLQETCVAYRTARSAFSENVKSLRAHLNWSQRRLAEEAGVSQAWINWMENREEAVAFPAMCHIAEVFGVSIATLITPNSFRTIAAISEKAAVKS